ncbi:hypothetical protein J2S59_000634 [Nocardioides massiliensis]|uniref:Uncharacterized protein n=1 Tax=Nocardioides massiliensis TaxID=1325935 RepID=A0ABT9NK82_9ACTN|nr:hypothetical protein [Nocardioides massiliensis]MDP9820825.1 hypothetical protein [Nocardioides massiliensis]
MARLRPQDPADADWVAWTLQTAHAHDQYLLHAYGGTKIGMGLDQVKNLNVPAVDRRMRHEISTKLIAEWDRHSSAVDALRHSIDLLAEYKTSLITAAVTGDLDVTTAGSGIPG